ncbi:MAG: ParA family protein, partial [Bdellovibrionota bacterium]
ILLTKFDAREKFSHEILQKCVSEYGDDLIKSYIRSSSEAKNTIRSNKTLFHGRSTAKEDYDIVTREMIGLNR